MPPKQPTSEYNFAAHYPHLLDEWDYEKNQKKPDQFTPKSGQRMWWICRKCGHNHQTQICNKIRPSNTKCKNCLGKVPHSDGHNSLATLRPILVKDWYDERSPKEFQVGSSYRARWKCHTCEHIWHTQISKRVELNRRCLSCTGQQAHSSGGDSVKVKNPELMDEWNDDRDPATFLPGSSVKVDWKCRDCNNEWPMQIKKRTGGEQGNSGCNFCNGPGGKHARVVHSNGHNSMRNTDDLMTREFHPTLNGKHTPDNLIAGTNEKLWWICSQDCDYIEGAKCENVWRNTGAHRVGGQKCPVHNGGLHPDGRNSLRTLIPKLMGEWDFERNTDLLPDEVTISSGRKAHWICKECNGKWYAIIANRSIGHGCSACKKKTQKILFDIVARIFPSCNPIFDHKHRDLRFSRTEKQLESGRKGALMELDIWIPERSLGIEYQGEQHYHSFPHWGGEDALREVIRRDKEKVAACEENGIELVPVPYTWDRTIDQIVKLLVSHGIEPEKYPRN